MPQVYGYVERADRRQPRAADLPVEQGVLRDRSVARLRARLHASSSAAAPGRSIEAVASEAKGILPWGADHHRVFRKLNGHRIGVSAICEDLPEEHNRVTLDPGAEGQPRHPGAEDRLHDQREQPEDDGARHRARPRRSSKPPARPTSASTTRSHGAAGICSAPRAWAPIPRARWSTNGAAPTT